MKDGKIACIWAMGSTKGKKGTVRTRFSYARERSHSSPIAVHTMTWATAHLPRVSTCQLPRRVARAGNERWVAGTRHPCSIKLNNYSTPGS